MRMVHTSATYSEVKQLLSDAKLLDRDRVKLSASNKSDLINVNLSDAVKNGVIPKHKVAALVQNAEENGKQHVFYFKAKSRTVANKYSKTSTIGKQLFTKKELASFPLFVEMPREYKWIDFRTQETGNLSNDVVWMAKAAGVEQVEVTLDSNQRIDSTRFAIVKQLEDARVVLVALLRSSGLLEIRVSQVDVGGDKFIQIYDHFIAMLGDAIDMDDFEYLDFDVVRKNLFNRRVRNAKLYELGNARLRDLANGSAQIVTSGRGDRLSNEPIRIEAVKSYLKEGRVLDSLVVFFLKNSKINGLEEKDVRIVVGPRRSTAERNEVFVSAQATRATMDYVTAQLIKFSK
tara:strand:- start:2242 stop:3279 length:1038 start_codon:yes stop_codon:yes gene_type:complete